MKPLLHPPSTAALTLATAVVALLAALMLGLLAPAWADPMRPLNPPDATPASTAASSPARAAADTPPAWPPLLALRQDSSGRHQALFGERWLAVGDRLGGSALVTAIDGQRVQLRQGRQTHTLHLLPPLRYSAAAASAAAPQAPATTRPPGPQRAPGR